MAVRGSKRERAVLPPGTLILDGRYEVVKCLHSKGMANVYIVKDRNLGKNWCLKEIIKTDAGKYNIEYISLLQEAKILRSVSHTGIPRITDTFEDGDSLMIIEDYVEGITLSKCIQAKGPIRQDIAVQWMKQLCQIMIYLHGLKTPILYRDMKPDNVIIQPDGNIKLLDYGTGIIIYSKGQLPHGHAMGTQGYAAPEQTKKDLPCDLRSDIYGLGMTYYSMLTGLNMSGISRDKLKDIDMVNPLISKGLSAVINKCIQVNPDDRYQDCNELMYALQNYMSGDEGYKKSAMKKIVITATSFFLSASMFCGSAILYSMNQRQLENNYNNAVLVAEQSGRVEDFESAIELKPSRLRPYFGYISAIKGDGVFSKEEESDILNYINPNLLEIKKDKDYGKLANELGNLYWFYYEAEDINSGKVQSVKWFKDSIDAGYDVEMSSVYYNIGMFHKDIAISIREAKDVGMYAEYWKNLLSAKEVTSGDIVTLQTNIAIADCIYNYSYNLKRDSISYEEVSSEIKDLKDFLVSFSASTSTVSTVNDLYEELKSITSDLQERVDVVYNIGGAN